MVLLAKNKHESYVEIHLKKKNKYILTQCWFEKKINIEHCNDLVQVVKKINRNA